MARSKGQGSRFTLSPQRRNELWGTLLVAGSLLLFMSLVSYDSNDLAFFSSDPNPQLQNLCGVVGAWIAGLIRSAFGLTAYLLPFLGFLWAFSRFSGAQLQKPTVKTISTILLCLSAAALFSLIWVQVPEARVYRGGMVGLVVGNQLMHYFGWWGATIVLMTVSLLCLILTTELAIWPFLSRLGDWLVKGSSWAGGRAKDKLTSGAERAKETLLQRFTLHRAAKPAVNRQAAFSTRDAEPVVKTTAPSEPSVPKEKLGADLEKAKTPKPPEPAQKPPKQAKPKTPESEPEEGAPEKLPIILPALDLLTLPVHSSRASADQDWARNNGKVLSDTLREFGIEVRVAEIELGPVVTRYELEPAPGVKIQKIAGLSDDIALALKSTSVRVIAPLPGKGRVGVEVPNPASAMVSLREVLESGTFKESESKLTLALGKDTAGHPLVADLARMPHLLIAGATGSGKTVCVNALITSILYNATPEDVRFLMVDPKMVELAVFNGLPHLIMPVVTSPKKVAAALNWVVEEMETRYRLFAKLGVRNIETYHKKQRAGAFPNEEIPENLPYLIVIIDELADLMLVAQAEIEKTIARLAHLSRAVGIHMILATQRPSVDVLTGVIKANFPARICFQVASKVDSRTVLDTMGAEKLIGKGDMLFLSPSSSKMIRGQGSCLTDAEIERVVEHFKSQRPASYEVDLADEVVKSSGGREQERDSMYGEAVEVVVETGQASVSLLQRRMRLGYGRAARILDMMEEEGIVGPIRGAKPREVYLKEVPTDEHVNR